MKRRTFLLLFPFLFLNICAQICTNEQPVSFVSEEISKKMGQEVIDRKCLPNLDMASIEKEDMEDEEYGYPPRFGFSHFVDFNLNNSGTWQELSNGDRIWRLIIYCPQAVSINLLYDKFWIPEGGKFFVYTSDGKHCLGAFTNKNNKGDRDNIKEYATGLLFSDEITLEYYQPRDVREEAIISISSVVHGYRSLGDSGSCQVNVNCSEGDNWQNEKKAVAKIIINGERLCTGSLLLTTSINFDPVFLTANHCIRDYGNALSSPTLSNTLFYWNYEAPGCSNNSYNPYYTYSVGATILANNSNSDFALLRLTEDPREVCSPQYLGWDRSGNSGSGGVGIHHPKGDLKKISTYIMYPYPSYYYNTSYNSNGNHWLVYWHATDNGFGTTEEGSSGSPLINSSHHVIGQLHGGNSSCLNLSGADWYGKFDTSWTGGGNSYDRLSDWLDPSGWGIIVMPGSADLIISGPEHLYDAGIYSLASLPSAMSVTWSLSGDNAADYIIEANTPSTNQCTITQKTDVDISGLAGLTLTAQIMYGGSVFYTASKNLTGHYIDGPMVPCGTTFYYVNPLPDNHTVEWEAEGQNLEYDSVPSGLIPDYVYPYYIIHQNNERHYGTLTATVKSGNTVVGTLVKQIDTAGGFSGTWYQQPTLTDSTNAVPQSFIHKSTLEIVPGRRVYLMSDDFIGNTITHTQNGFTIFDWTNSNGVISFIPFSSGNGNLGSITISGSSSDGCKTFWVFLRKPLQPITPIHLSVNSSDGSCQFTLSEDEEARSSSEESPGIPTEWQIVITKSDTGRTVYQSSVSSTSKTVGTTGWESGVYIATALVDGQSVSCKFAISK